MQKVLALLVQGKEIPPDVMRDTIHLMMSGEADPVQVGGFLSALSLKGETVGEVTAAVKAMQELALPVSLAGDEVMVDPVGTGGDGASLFNVSTASAIVAAAGGVKIAKHGNVAASSASGSADVLREAGVDVALSPEQVKACVENTGFGFMFAQAYHQAVRHVVHVRRALGHRTLFNVLGPLSNPAGVRHQVLGVFSRDWLRPMAEVARELGRKRVLVVHSRNGLDEFSVTHINDVAELKENGEVIEYALDPRELGLHHDSHDSLKVGNARESLALIEEIMKKQTPEAGFDMLSLNAAAIFYVAGVVADLQDGVLLAKSIMKDGRAWAKMQEVIRFSRSLQVSR